MKFHHQREFDTIDRSRLSEKVVLLFQTFPLNLTYIPGLLLPILDAIFRRKNYIFFSTHLESRYKFHDVHFINSAFIRIVMMILTQNSLNLNKNTKHLTAERSCHVALDLTVD